MNFKNKKILITAGPTWVPIDKVRVISNIATGQTGILLAKEAERVGAKVTLLLGPVGEVSLEESINLKRFFYFDELHNLIKKELKKKKYDIVIHSAAVSDYKPKKIFAGKIRSTIDNFSLDLETTVKIVDKIKKYAPEVFLVVFKLEVIASKGKMIQKTKKIMQEANADLAVANTFTKRSYQAFIIDKYRILNFSNSKEELVEKLLLEISKKI